MSRKLTISEELGHIAAVNLRCVAPNRRKATETEGLVIFNSFMKYMFNK